MSRVDHCRGSLAIAPWVLAGALLLGGGASVAAQDAATPAPMTVTEESTEQPATAAAETPAAASSAAAPSQVPRTGVGADATGGGPMALGALAGAVIAAAAALRERFARR
jgi:hypothetical protein